EVPEGADAFGRGLLHRRGRRRTLRRGSGVGGEGGARDGEGGGGGKRSAVHGFSPEGAVVCGAYLRPNAPGAASGNAIGGPAGVRASSHTLRGSRRTGPETSAAARRGATLCACLN